MQTDTNMQRMRRAAALAIGASILLVAAAGAMGGPFTAGGLRVFGPVAPAQLVPTEDAGNAVAAFAPEASPPLPMPPGTAPKRPAISIAGLPAAHLAIPRRGITPLGASIVADSGSTGPGSAWTATPRVGQTVAGAVSWAPPATRTGSLTLPADPPAGDKLRLFVGDGGSLLAQGPSPGQAPAAPNEEAREADLARQLANPISSLISVPFQQNIEFGIGPANAGWHDVMNIQPVVPFGISEKWNLIARMIMPVVYQDEIFPGAGSQFGIGDTTFQFFFSPKAPTQSGVIWGAGPLFFIPSGAYLLSTSTWGAGVDAVALRQVPKPYMGGGVLTYGALATQLWPVSGSAPINSLLLQPFVSYSLKSSLSFTLQSQATYNWTQSQWTIPLIASVGKIYRFGGQLTQLSFGLKYYPVRPVTAPRWGVQVNVTLLFPRK